jgi:hypothetical protein
MFKLINLFFFFIPLSYSAQIGGIPISGTYSSGHVISSSEQEVLTKKGYNLDSIFLNSYPFGSNNNVRIIQVNREEIIVNKKFDTLQVWTPSKVKYSTLPSSLKKKLKKRYHKNVYVHAAHKIVTKTDSIFYRVVLEQPNKNLFRFELWCFKGKKDKYVIAKVTHSGNLLKNNERLRIQPYLISLDNYIDTEIISNR